MCVKAAIPKHPIMFPRRRTPYAEHVLCVLMRAADSQALVMCVQLDIVGGLQCVLESFDSLMPNPYFQKPLANSLFCYVFGPLHVGPRNTKHLHGSDRMFYQVVRARWIQDQTSVGVRHPCVHRNVGQEFRGTGSVSWSITESRTPNTYRSLIFDPSCTYTLI